jgi:selenocysteine lyase/cysteine desulfurase
MCIRLKEEMGVANIQLREKELLTIIFSRLSKMKHIQILEPAVTTRLGVISFIVVGIHYNLIVKILSDRFGIQMRGGCSCAGPYGHILLNVNKQQSYEILNSIRQGDLSCKPGWVRLSIHPVMTDAEINFIMDALESTISNIEEWVKDYSYDPHSNEYFFKKVDTAEKLKTTVWFDASRW